MEILVGLLAIRNPDIAGRAYGGGDQQPELTVELLINGFLDEQ
jgi:hypothetical protein